MYQALYRKDRPRTFSDVDGQEHVTETLRRQVVTGRLSHAYLFVGTRGTGKTTCAKILSRAVNCSAHVDGDPCNECKSCLGIGNGGILDVLEIDAASNSGVDNVRALREEAIYTPASVSKRVYIIDEVHMLSTAAFNALLKIMEEPPAHLLFILATTELHKVPVTILSRCQRFSFRRLSQEVLNARLCRVAENEGLVLSAEAADKLSVLADGSMRDALSLLDQCASTTDIDLEHVLSTIGLAGTKELLSIAEKIAGGEIAAALGTVDSLYKDGKDVTSLLNELAVLIRDLLLYKLAPSNPLLSGIYRKEELEVLSHIWLQERLLYSLDLIRESVAVISRGSAARIAAEMCLIRMCDLKLSANSEAVLARLEKLESKPPPVTHIETDAASHQPPVGELPQPAVEDPVPEPTAVNSAESPDNDYWQQILAELKSEPQAYTALSNANKVQPELRKNAVILRAVDEFSVGLIKGKSIFEPLNEAVMKVLGNEVVITVEVDPGIIEKARQKLDQLSRFDIVKIE